jgi:hypothetical protein
MAERHDSEVLAATGFRRVHSQDKDKTVTAFTGDCTSRYFGDREKHRGEPSERTGTSNGCLFGVSPLTPARKAKPGALA